MKVAIVGSRNFWDYEFLKNKLSPYVNNIDRIISGGAQGADTLAERFAHEYNIPTTVYPANWRAFGKKAGFLRNAEIVKNSDVVIAFQVNESKGTQHTIDLAKKHNKKLKVYNIEK